MTPIWHRFTQLTQGFKATVHSQLDRFAFEVIEYSEGYLILSPALLS